MNDFTHFSHCTLQMTSFLCVTKQVSRCESLLPTLNFQKHLRVSNVSSKLTLLVIVSTLCDNYPSVQVRLCSFRSIYPLESSGFFREPQHDVQHCTEVKSEATSNPWDNGWSRQVQNQSAFPFILENTQCNSPKPEEFHLINRSFFKWVCDW